MNKYEAALVVVDILSQESPNGFKYLKSHYNALKELVDKATPKKPSMEWMDSGTLDVGKTEACPNCLYQGVYKEDDEYWFDGISYCRRCGQAIDWSGNE